MIRPGIASDIPGIAAIYDHILTLEEQGRMSTGWIRNIYPTLETAQTALTAGELFVDENSGKILAAARINRVQVPEYALAHWTYPAPENQVMVLHTLVVDPSAAGQGIGSRFVQFYEEYAANRDCPFLRMDTNVINTAARRLYKKLGYQEVGVVPCNFNGIPDVRLVCLEKRL
jgi:ribosomal protein S18 acetylase RimI-like enzyme